MERKDELVDQAKESARGTAQRVLDDLKDKAVANPAAALAIGAGLAWRLVRHPPIASLLVGVGMVSLLRTSASKSKQPYMGLYDEDARAGSNDGSIAARASELAGSARDRLQDWGAEAGETARETAVQLTDKAAAMAGRASDAAHATVNRVTDKVAAMTDRAAEAARETVTQISHKAAAVTDKASSALHDAIPDAKLATNCSWERRLLRLLRPSASPISDAIKKSGNLNR